MKKTGNLVALLFGIILTTLWSCEDRVVQTKRYTANVPVYMSRDELNKSVVVHKTAATPMENPGKMYIFGHTLFVNELFEGVHVIDNSDPANPQKIAFIEIPANVDIAVKGNTLYADNYTDLVTLDISDLNNIVETSRLEKVFEQLYPAWDQAYPLGEIDQDQGVVVGWTLGEVETSREIDVRSGWGTMEDGAMVDIVTNDAAGGSEYAANTVGQGGSMARFLIFEDYLYTVHGSQLQVFDISNQTSPAAGAVLETWHNVETVYRLDNHLFIGSTTGMIIYNIEQPSNPVYVSDIWHWNACDPVVVSGNTAYVTLRGGNQCGSNMNLLQIYDVSNLAEPKMLKEYEMEGPYGLGIDGNTLFVCDGAAGLKIYDATDPLKIDENMLAHYNNYNAYDVIPINPVLMLIGKDGLYQYDYSDLQNISLLSTIPVEAQ